MKRILAPILIALTFTVMFSSTSSAGWTKVSSAGGYSFYVDFERIRKVDGFVYFWNLSDYLKPTKFGDLSSKVYYQGDCKIFRMKRLTSFYYAQPMGEGTTSSISNKPKGGWDYPSPNTHLERILKSVCSR